MHGARVVREKERAFSELRGKLIERCLPDPVQTMAFEHLLDGSAALGIGRRAEEDPLHGAALGDGESGFGKSFRQPALGRSVLRAGTQADPGRCAVGFEPWKKL